MNFSVAELCAGGGGQALGLEMAGFSHAAAVEYIPQYCETLRLNRPGWEVFLEDLRDLAPSAFAGVDLLAAGVPCPPFSVAGKGLGGDDERDMFPAVLDIIRGSRPRAVLFENVQGLAAAKFSGYRQQLLQRLSGLGYQPEWKVVQSADFNVPQLRPRFVLVAMRPRDAEFFRWPLGERRAATVGQALVDLMGSRGWPMAEDWSAKANRIAPTIVGGSLKHGGPDLGPTRAKAQWRELGVDGMGIANEPPGPEFPADSLPRLTVRMAARIQGFPDLWEFAGKKTVAYRQVGNAFPPPVACAIGRSIRAAFERELTLGSENIPADLEARLLEEPPQPIAKCRPKKARRS